MKQVLMQANLQRKMKKQASTRPTNLSRPDADALGEGLEGLSTAMEGFEESLAEASQSMNKMNEELSSSSKLVAQTRMD